VIIKSQNWSDLKTARSIAANGHIGGVLLEIRRPFKGSRQGDLNRAQSDPAENKRPRQSRTIKCLQEKSCGPAAVLAQWSKRPRDVMKLDLVGKSYDTAAVCCSNRQFSKTEVQRII